MSLAERIKGSSVLKPSAVEVTLEGIKIVVNVIYLHGC